tara:strand:+ start:1301 stop:1822 length:522 start_codon:yes stop_codon:yes gene_type:complete
MKLLIIYIFIFLASSTYRCSDGGQIDCATASQEMIGVWEGELVYERPNSARNKRNKQTLVIESSEDCSFNGFSSYDDSNNTFRITGKIDVYGWVEFIEEEFISNDGSYQECLNRTNSSAVCYEWPDLRWKEGTKFEETRFRREPYILRGTFHRPSSFERWWQILRGDYTLSKQ